MLDALKNIVGQKILVVGDVMLDHYVWGEVERISPEAPVPVVRVLRENDMPGAAANVAVNLAALGVTPVMLSIIGNDLKGMRLRELLEQHNVCCDHLIIDDQLQTTCKERILAQSQHVVRVDRDAKLDAAVIERSNILKKFENVINDCDAVVVQDYNKGLLDQRFFEIAKSAKVPIIVDPNRYHSIRYYGSLATPNIEEARILAGNPCPLSDAIDNLPIIANAIFERHDLENLVITLGDQGISLCQKNGEIQYHPAAQTHDVYDVSGAGDTVAAVLAATLAGGADLWHACKIANVAGSIVVGKMGTAKTSRQEIQDLIDIKNICN